MRSSTSISEVGAAHGKLAGMAVVPVSEYLNTRYRPDVEYVDGALLRRGARTGLSSIFHALLTEYFRRQRKSFGYVVYTEPRTEIVPGARYRLPDVMLAPLPAIAGRVIHRTPWALVEIQSPDDKSRDQWRRFQDYLSIGVPHVILLDPEESLAFRCQPHALVEAALTGLELPTGRLPFDTASLFRQLAEELSES